jgi:hypothetical protein
MQIILTFSTFFITASMAAMTTSWQLSNLENQHSTSCVKIKHVRLFQYVSAFRGQQNPQPWEPASYIALNPGSVSFNHLIKMCIHFTSYFSNIHCNTSFPPPPNFPITAKFSDCNFILISFTHSGLQFSLIISLK